MANTRNSVKNPAGVKGRIRPATKTQEVIKLQKHRVAQCKFMQKVKRNSKRYAEHLKRDRERKQKAKETGKLKLMSDLNEREKRVKRKAMRDYMREYRMKKKAKDQTSEDTNSSYANSSVASPDSPTSNNPNCSIPGTTLADTSNSCIRERMNTIGRKKLRRDRTRLYRRNKELERQKEELQRQVWRYKKRMYRSKVPIKSQELTPRSKVSKLTEGMFVSKKIRKELFVGAVVQEEIKEVSKRIGHTTSQKVLFSKLFTGKILKKYRCLKHLKQHIPNYTMRKSRKDRWSQSDAIQVKRMNSISIKIRQTVEKFFLGSKGSHETPGKKSFVKIKGEKLQKRYLNDTLRNLYQIFLDTSPPLTVCFSTFCALRPPQCVVPKLSGRDTCLCKLCENFKLLVRACKQHKIVKDSNRAELINSICCEKQTEDCLFRKCGLCKGKKLHFIQQNEVKTVKYSKWDTMNETRISTKTKKPITVKITKKIEVTAKKQDVTQLLDREVVKQMAHLGRMNHQRNQWSFLKDNISESDLLINMDWSEDWECKYSDEIQSAHYGGSNKRIALHTGIVYCKGKAETFCTISNSTRHDPSAIIAHLHPILERHTTPNTKNLHLMTDGPTSQYRSKIMFAMATSLLNGYFPNLESIIWNFSEAGHGKNVADGVGGTIKRTADSVVAHGEDIADIQKFHDVLSTRINKIYIKVIEPEDISALDRLADQAKGVDPFKGTMSVHQWLWKSSSPKEIHFKTLSCYDCKNQSCDHYSMGKPWIPLNSKNKRSDRSYNKKQPTEIHEKNKEVAKKSKVPKTKEPSRPLRKSSRISKM